MLLIHFFQPDVIQSVTPQVEALCGVLVETLNSDAAELLPLASQSLSSLCRTEALGVDDDRCVTYLKLIVTQAMKSTDISLRYVTFSFMGIICFCIC